MKKEKSRRVIAVVGAFSFWGRRLLRLLFKDKSYSKIVALDVRPPSESSDKLVYERIDLTEPGADQHMAELFAEHAVETVVQLAYLSRPVQQQAWAHELETIGTMYVLNACTQANVQHLVSLSTTMCYGALPKNPNLLTENHPLTSSRSSRWVADKVDAERQIAAFAKSNPGKTTTVLRLAATLGSSVDNYWTWLLSRPMIYTLMGHDPLLQFLHEEDAVTALKMAVDNTPDAVFNIVAPGVLPLSRVVQLLGRRPLPVPAPLATGLSQALWTAQVSQTPPSFLNYLRYIWVCDGSRAEQKMGFVAARSTKQTVLSFAQKLAGESISVPVEAQA